MKFVRIIDHGVLRSLKTTRFTDIDTTAYYVDEEMWTNVCIIVPYSDDGTYNPSIFYRHQVEVGTAIRQLIDRLCDIALREISTFGMPYDGPANIRLNILNKDHTLVTMDGKETAIVRIDADKFTDAVVHAYLVMGLGTHTHRALAHHQFENNQPTILKLRDNDALRNAFKANIKLAFRSNAEYDKKDVLIETPPAVPHASSQMSQVDAVNTILDLATKYTTCCVPLGWINAIRIDIRKSDAGNYAFKVVYIRAGQSERASPVFDFELIDDTLCFNDSTEYTREHTRSYYGIEVVPTINKYNSVEPADIPVHTDVDICRLRTALYTLHVEAIPAHSTTEVLLFKYGPVSPDGSSTIKEIYRWDMRIKHIAKQQEQLPVDAITIFNQG